MKNVSKTLRNNHTHTHTLSQFTTIKKIEIERLFASPSSSSSIVVTRICEINLNEFIRVREREKKFSINYNFFSLIHFYYNDDDDKRLDDRSMKNGMKLF